MNEMGLLEGCALAATATSSNSRLNSENTRIATVLQLNHQLNTLEMAPTWSFAGLRKCCHIQVKNRLWTLTLNP